MTTKQYCDRLQSIEETVDLQEGKMARLICNAPAEVSKLDQTQATTAIHKATREVRRLRAKVAAMTRK